MCDTIYTIDDIKILPTPITEEELKNIIGVGVHKAQKYGKPFIETIKNNAETNNITHPQDLVIK